MYEDSAGVQPEDLVKSRLNWSNGGKSPQSPDWTVRYFSVMSNSFDKRGSALVQRRYSPQP